MTKSELTSEPRLIDADYLAALSHELRTPMNAIIGYTGTLLMRLPGPLTDEQHKQLETIQASARHLLALLDDLLELAGIESGRAAVTLEDVDASAVVAEVAETLRPLAARKGLRCEAALPAHELTLRTDAHALRRIALNLLATAIDVTARGGVAIALERRTVDGRRGAAVVAGSTGGGGADLLRQPLEGFGRIDCTSAGARPSTALGLELAERLANLIGGRVVGNIERGTDSRGADALGTAGVFALLIAEQ